MRCGAFGWDIHLCDGKPEPGHPTTRAVVYRLRDTDFLKAIDTYQWGGVSANYDFRMFYPVIAYKNRGEPADYDYLAEASEGVQWLGAMRMDIDDLGSIIVEELQDATLSRLATFSEALCLFFEGYVPKLCAQYNQQHKRDRGKEILELIYAGGDDLFLVGGWSALPVIAREIRSAFGAFVTGDHVTLSGGIAIEHKKYPLYQFAAASEAAEKDAKDLSCKDAITFLREPMKWAEFDLLRDWHDAFMTAVGTDTAQLPSGFLTRLSQLYSAEELKGHRWAWRSLYYFHRLKARYKAQETFLDALKSALNHPETEFELQKFIHIITRWTALRLRK